MDVFVVVNTANSGFHLLRNGPVKRILIRMLAVDFINKLHLALLDIVYCAPSEMSVSHRSHLVTEVEQSGSVRPVLKFGPWNTSSWAGDRFYCV